MTQDGEPFYSGTYFPRETFQRLVLGVAKAWREDRDAVRGQAGHIAATLAEQAAPLLGQAHAADLAALSDQAVTTLAADYDEQHGGVGGGPAVPPAVVVGVLLRPPPRPAPRPGGGRAPPDRPGARAGADA